MFFQWLRYSIGIDDVIPNTVDVLGHIRAECAQSPCRRVSDRRETPRWICFSEHVSKRTSRPLRAGPSSCRTASLSIGGDHGWPIGQDNRAWWDVLQVGPIPQSFARLESNGRPCHTVEIRVVTFATGSLSAGGRKMALRTARRLVVRGRPPGRAAGRTGATKAHAASVRSVS